MHLSSSATFPFVHAVLEYSRRYRRRFEGNRKRLAGGGCSQTNLQRFPRALGKFP